MPVRVGPGPVSPPIRLSRVAGREDASMKAVVVGRFPLTYAAGASARDDRPAHVRAGSGLAFVDTPRGRRLVVVQDDASFLALIDPSTKKAEAVALPRGPGGLRQFDALRGNKHDKLDLEAVATLPVDGTMKVVAFGSGSRAKREQLAVLDPATRDVVMVDGHRLYEALRAHPGLQGADLNLEGAGALPDGTLRLLQRGNGAGGRDAFIDVSWPALWRALTDPAQKMPAFHVVPVELGHIGGVRLTPTDLARRGDEQLFVAAAEASPNAVDDGVVTGAAVGVLHNVGRDVQARWARLVDERGRPVLDKPEGIAVDPADPSTLWLVTDNDDPRAPAELLQVRLTS